ncbi:hypothetical protein BDF21DRAFT_441699 [Thamnidium elegans]|nr:hypothetical protein BDF21DRAFT_441699 [Thamnidium elegans]
MSNSPVPVASRLADYFFVAGLHDSYIMPAYESAKKYQRTGDTDISYYQQQEQAVASNGNLFERKLDFEVVDNSKNGRRRGHSLSVGPTEPSGSLRSTFPEVATSASLLGVLDHVQHVIDNFDKERDTARDNVIAVHESLANHTEKYKRSDSDKTITPSNRMSTYSTETTNRRVSIRDVAARKWRSPSEPKLFENTRKNSTKVSTTSVPTIPLEPEVVPNILDLQYTPTILMRYPKINYSPEEPFPAYAAMAMTDENGATVYGSCVVFYEKLTDNLKESVNKAIQEWVKTNMSFSSIEYSQHLKADSARQASELEERIKTCQENIELYKELLEPVKMGVCTAEEVWVPKSIGLLGRMPWINLYGDWIRILLDNIVGVGGHKNGKPTIDIESTVINLIEEVPLPPPGRFEIGLTINGRPLFFSRPPINEVPILKNTLLAEGKVVFLSKYTGMLSLACESFRYLLFPFYWQFVFIPVLPERLLTCLQAPVPYIIGFPGDMTDLEDHAPDDACIVNLDSNTMHQSQRSMPIPDRQRRKLQSALEQYAPLHTKSKIPYGVPLPIQCTFPKGKLILNCSRSKSTDIFISPARLPRDSESSDATSIWSHPASLVSRPSGFWSSNASTRSSNESAASDAPNLPQYPGSALLSTSTGNYASSNNSLHSPPMSPTRTAASIQSIQSSLSTSSLPRTPNQQRVSMPSPIVNAANPTNSTTLDHQNSYRKTNYRRSEPSPKPKREDTPKTKLSTFMSKPRATFHQEQIDNNSNSMAPSPRISISSPRFTANNFDHGYHNEVPRRVKHIEGHIMAEIFTSELGRFQGYRCVCGKQVSEDEDNKPRMFMCCQECHLVTHDSCTNQILHPCLPACFNEQKVLDSFIRMFASLLYNYRTGFVDHLDDKSTSISANDINNNNGNCLYFSKDRFLKHSDKDTREFLSSLSNSQMFTQFITDRLLKPNQEPEILVFDEYIKLKLNRSKLKFVKEDTPFLNDDSFRVSQIIWATPPPDNVIIGQGECRRFPTNLQFYNK